MSQLSKLRQTPAGIFLNYYEAQPDKRSAIKSLFLDMQPKAATPQSLRDLILGQRGC